MHTDIADLVKNLNSTLASRGYTITLASDGIATVRSRIVEYEVRANEIENADIAMCNAMEAAGFRMIDAGDDGADDEGGTAVWSTWSRTSTAK